MSDTQGIDAALQRVRLLISIESDARDRAALQAVLDAADPRKDLAVLEELVAKWRGLRGVDWSAEPDGWKVTFNVCADELEQRLAEMRGAKR